MTNIEGKFKGLSVLTTLDVSNFNTSKVKYMRGMFDGINIPSLDISNFDMSKVIDMNDEDVTCN